MIFITLLREELFVGVSNPNKGMVFSDSKSAEILEKLGC